MNDLVERLRSVDISWSETGEWCAEAADRIERLTADLHAAMSELNACKDALAQHNDRLRSAQQIAFREGAETNWKAFRGQCAYTLAEFHELVNECRAALEEAGNGRS